MMELSWSEKKQIDPLGFESHFTSLNDSIDAVFYHDTSKWWFKYLL